MGKITWNNLHEASPTELMKTYKISQAQLEMAHRRHLDGANQQQRRDEYDQLWKKNRRDV
jgi:hypothetical protein